MNKSASAGALVAMLLFAGCTGLSDPELGAKSPASRPFPGPAASPACANCENAGECAELSECSVLRGNATEGPAAGTPRSTLCNETLACVFNTGCAKGLLIDCYCGTVSSADCDAGKGNGKCRTVIERGVETTNPAEVHTRLQNLTLGGGLALARAGCDQINCPVCF